MVFSLIQNFQSSIRCRDTFQCPSPQLQKFI